MSDYNDDSFDPPSPVHGDSIGTRLGQFALPTDSDDDDLLNAGLNEVKVQNAN